MSDQEQTSGPEPIETYYRHRLMDAIEELLAYLSVQHREEMRWIARAKEAEALVASLSVDKGELMCRVQFAEIRVAECACPPEIFPEKICPRCGGRKIF